MKTASIAMYHSYQDRFVVVLTQEIQRGMNAQSSGDYQDYPRLHHRRMITNKQTGVKCIAGLSYLPRYRLNDWRSGRYKIIGIEASSQHEYHIHSFQIDNETEPKPTMTSNPPGSCCYKGVKHEGQAVGRFEQVDDFEVYISESTDKSTENGILMYDSQTRA